MTKRSRGRTGPMCWHVGQRCTIIDIEAQRLAQNQPDRQTSMFCPVFSDQKTALPAVLPQMVHDGNNITKSQSCIVPARIST